MKQFPHAIFTAAAMVAAAMVAGVTGKKQGDPPTADPNELPGIPALTAFQVQKYAMMGGTDAEIADRFLIGEDLLREMFAGELRSTRALRRMIIRACQLDGAKKLNASLLIWLGRNELGQSINPTTPGMPEPGLEAVDTG